jgi:hypothetical protein
MTLVLGELNTKMPNQLKATTTLLYQYRASFRQCNETQFSSIYNFIYTYNIYTYYIYMLLGKIRAYLSKVH